MSILLVLSVFKWRITRNARLQTINFLVTIICKHYMSLLFLVDLNYDNFLNIRKVGTERELSLASGSKKKKKKLVIAIFCIGRLSLSSSGIHFLMPEKQSPLQSMGEATRTQRTQILH